MWLAIPNACWHGRLGAVAATTLVLSYESPCCSVCFGSDMADIPLQLATLLGKDVVRLRKVDGQPPRVAVIDVISAITGKDARHAAEQLRRLIAQYPDLDTDIRAVRLQDARGRKGPKETPVAGIKGIVKI